MAANDNDSVASSLLDEEIRGATAPATPARRGANDDDDDDDSLVPATPAAPRRHDDDDIPTTPLTPLSPLQQEEEEDANDAGVPADAPANNNVDDDEPLLDADRALIRGTDVHVPTAAAAFVDFLRNFRSLAASRRQQQQGEDANDDDDDDESMASSTAAEEEEAPLYLTKLERLLTHGATGDETGATASLDVDTMHIFYHSEQCQRFYHQLVSYPMELVPLMDILVQKELERLSANMDNETIMPPRVQVRPFNLRKVSNLRCLDPISMDNLVSLRGMVVRCSPLIPDLKVAHFGCAICGNGLQVSLDRGRIQEPTAPCSVCNVSAWTLIHNRSVFGDKQLIRLQETPDQVPAGQTPAAVTLFGFDDLVDTVSPGDKVEVTGVLRAQPARVNPKISKIKAVYKTYVDVIHYAAQGMNRHQKKASRWTTARVAELQAKSRESDVYQQLTDSLAPSIWELDDVKRGILCMLFGGNQVRVKRGTAAAAATAANRESSWLDEDNDDGEPNQAAEPASTSKLYKRGDINILLCGDPGTSKSQLLSYVHKLSARGVYTSGKGSSAVGLTASVVRDPETRDLVLESGALVLSDLGICCIDEFDKMSDTTRSVLHEAMEQQTVSIAKAGIIATLHARTSVLASANPVESRYNPNRSVVDNIQLPPTLLSRFDLIYLILDQPNVDTDRRLAQHLVGLYYETPNVVEPPIDQDFLKDYIEYAREHVHPELSDEATQQLMTSYLELRNPPGAGQAGVRTISATPRQLESLVRLAEGLAKMRYSAIVTGHDAREAVRLLRVATQTAATDPRTGRIDMDMITTGRSSADRVAQDQMDVTLRELFAERRGTRMAVRDIQKQLQELDLQVDHDQVVEALRALQADGAIQFQERAQTVYVRTGIGR